MIELLVEAAGWGAIPSASLDVIWMLIGAVALVRVAGRRRTEGVSR